MNQPVRNDDTNSADNPQLANLVKPTGTYKLNGLTLDMKLFAEAADKLGAGKLDTLSIAGYRNSKGELIPDYSSVKIERRADPADVAALDNDDV